MPTYQTLKHIILESNVNRIATVFCAWMLIGLPSYSAVAQPAIQAESKAQADPIEARYKLAGENRSELEQALKLVPKDQRAAVEFLILNMRKKDLQSLSADFLLDNVRVAYEARKAAPWADQVSDDLFFSDILPYANIDEKRENWRAKLREICWPIVKDCKTTGEAAQELNKQLFKKVKVKYSTKRKKANQSPGESMESGLASCTGLSILLADACRSVHVPARLAGIPQWSNKRGNHTWVEVWDDGDGDWHFTGAAEYNAKGLDRAWFKRDASLADKSKRMNSIYAMSFARTDTVFPLLWSRERVYAINVTDRYAPPSQDAPKADANKIQVRIRVWNSDRSERVATKVTVVQVSEKLSEPAERSGTSPSNTADMNDMLEFELQRGAAYELQVKNGENLQTQRFTTTDDATQLIEVQFNGEDD